MRLSYSFLIPVSLVKDRIHSANSSKSKPFLVHIKYMDGLYVILLYLFMETLEIQAVLSP